VRTKPQSFLPGLNLKASASHGGELSRGKRKTYRPIDPKQALHVVLRSSRARGKLSMLHPDHCDAIETFTRQVAFRRGITLYRYANVGNHLHLLVRAPSRIAWQRFLRELSGGIAILVTGARKGSALKRNETQRGFWDHLAFTRIVSFGRDFERLARYFIKNIFEAAGIPMKKLLAQGYRIASIGRDGVLRP
jgi:hypothetical protein